MNNAFLKYFDFPTLSRVLLLLPLALPVHGQVTTVVTNTTVADGTDFGTVVVAGGVETHAFTIENAVCSQDLEFDGLPLVEIAGPDQGDFSVTLQPTVNPVSGGGSTTIDVKFDPSALGVRSGVIVITHNDLPENPFVFTVSGVGQ